MPIEWSLTYSVFYLFFAWSDIQHRRLPNKAILLLLGVWSVSLVYNQNLPPQSLTLLSLTLISVLVIGVGLQSILGAGDTKLIASSLLITADPKLLVSIGIFGGVISLMTLLASKIAQQNKDVPYGVAISAATLLQIWGT